MSVFDQTNDQQTTQTKSEQTNNESFVQRLVKEKGEQWGDPEVIAKGKLEADQFIADLQAQLDGMREDLNKQEYAKELLTKLQEKAPPTAGGKPEDKSGGSTQDNTSLSASDIERLIEQTLTAREQTMTANQRLTEVDSKMTEMFGTEAHNIVVAKAKELGMTVERMKEIASESPNAFFSLIGEAPKQQTNQTPKSTLNTAAGFTSTSERNFAYYQEMRRKKPSEFWSVKVQREMLEDRKRLGDKFY